VRLIALILILVFAIETTLYSPAAYAATATFNSGDSTAQAQIPVNKIGALLLADATAFLNGSMIEVKGKAPDNTDQTLLSGTAFNTHIVGSGSNRAIRGTAIFQGGFSFASLTRAGDKPARVQTTSGEIIEGAISDISPTGISVGGRSIDASALKCVDSPSAFEFEIPLSGSAGVSSVTGEASRIKFSSCSVSAPARIKEKKPSTVSAVQHPTRTKVIIALVLIACVATAIAVPIAVSAGRRRHRNNNNNDLAVRILQQQALTNSRRSMQQEVSSVIQNPFSSSSSSP